MIEDAAVAGFRNLPLEPQVKILVRLFGHDVVTTLHAVNAKDIVRDRPSGANLVFFVTAKMAHVVFA